MAAKVHDWGKAFTSLFGSSARQQLVEDVKRPLVLRLSYGARLLQEVGLDVRARYVAGCIKVYPYKLSLNG